MENSSKKSSVAYKSHAESYQSLFGTTQTKKPGEEPILVADLGIKVRAIADYAAEDIVELSFKEGDIILVSEKHKSGWW